MTRPDCLVREAQDFTPMTRTERWAHFVNTIASPEPLVYALLHAGYNQAFNSPREWHRDWSGFGYRLGDAEARFLMQQILEQGMAAGLGEDNRYFASGKTGFGPRLEYAITSTFLARRANGSRGISYSFLGGAAGAALASRPWQPRSTGSLGTAAWTFGAAIGFQMGENVVREFMPRLARVLLR